jgi:hypothetical protein
MNLRATVATLLTNCPANRGKNWGRTPVNRTNPKALLAVAGK